MSSNLVATENIVNIRGPITVNCAKLAPGFQLWNVSHVFGLNPKWERGKVMSCAL